jgi:hypothetical protein
MLQRSRFPFISGARDISLLDRAQTGSGTYPETCRIVAPGNSSASYITHVRFEVITTVTVKNAVFWDVTPCSLVEVYRYFGRIFCMHLYGRRISKQIMLHASLADSSTLKMESGCSLEC